MNAQAKARKSTLNTTPFIMKSKTPDKHSVIPRVVNFTFDDKIPKHWQGEVFATRMLDAMQLAFPDGERMFIQSVRNYSDQITDPILQAQVKEFIFQEAQHGKAHSEFTDYLTEQGLKVNGAVKQIKNLLDIFQKRTPKKFQLAATVAAEHLTATLGEHMMTEKDNLIDKAHPTMKAFYMWHAIEEVEHKAVAWDVYQHAAGGGYLTRATAMALLYPLALIPLTAGTLAMMYVDGELNSKEIAKGAKVMFGSNGIWRKTFPEIMKFYSPNFHPWQTGYPPLFDKWKAVYEETQDPIKAMKAVQL